MRTNLATETERLRGSKRVDFGFWSADFASQDGRRCVAAQLLPEWNVDIIETGQFDKKGRLWSVRVEFSETGEAPVASVIRSTEAPTPVENLTPQAGDKQAVQSHLYAFDLWRVPIAKSATTGGAIEPLGNDLLVALPQGDLAVVRYDGKLERLHESIQ